MRWYFTVPHETHSVHCCWFSFFDLFFPFCPLLALIYDLFPLLFSSFFLPLYYIYILCHLPRNSLFSWESFLPFSIDISLSRCCYLILISLRCCLPYPAAELPGVAFWTQPDWHHRCECSLPLCIVRHALDVVTGCIVDWGDYPRPCRMGVTVLTLGA